MSTRSAGAASRPGSKKRSTQTPSHELARQVVDAMLERKATDITVMDLRAVDGAVADFFVNATGGSDRQVRAVASAVIEQVKETCQERPWHDEGMDHLRWVLLDYVDVVVHVFSQERREYYDLERLWGDAVIERVPEDGAADGVAVLYAAAHESPSEAGADGPGSAERSLDQDVEAE